MLSKQLVTAQDHGGAEPENNNMKDCTSTQSTQVIPQSVPTDTIDYFVRDYNPSWAPPLQPNLTHQLQVTNDPPQLALQPLHGNQQGYYSPQPFPEHEDDDEDFVVSPTESLDDWIEDEENTDIAEALRRKQDKSQKPVRSVIPESVNKATDFRATFPAPPLGINLYFLLNFEFCLYISP